MSYSFRWLRSVIMAVSGSELESKFVRDVYREIAPHFSDTRHKPWPKVKDFITRLPRGSLVADIGCGNGKYHHVTSDSFVVGCDNCKELLEIAADRGGEVIVGDCLQLPFRAALFDSVISIAVIHHLSTVERRVKAIEEICRITRPGGSILVYVWAFEQDRRKFDEQDVMVPWHLQPKYQETTATQTATMDSSCLTKEDHLHKLGYRTFHRYYHLFKKGELMEIFKLANQTVRLVEEYHDHDNWCVLAIKQ